MLVTPASRAAESIARLYTRSGEPSSTPGRMWQWMSLMLMPPRTGIGQEGSGRLALLLLMRNARGIASLLEEGGRLVKTVLSRSSM